MEAQTIHYIGDSLVADFGDAVIRVLDRISGEVVRRALCEREDQDVFALDQVTPALRDDPGQTECVAAYALRVAGGGHDQTRRALDSSREITELLGREEGEKRLILDLLDRHRRRLDGWGSRRWTPSPRWSRKPK